MSKSTVSEAKRAANARNGKRGGPKTPEGRSRSRMNGLRHGMRAELVVLLPGEDEEKFRRRLDAWAGDLQPHGAVERYQVETAVVASWRRDRCLRAETAVLTDRVLDAADPDPEAEDARARRLGARLARDPAAVAHKLRTTVAGCRWMLRRWDDLGATLDEAGFWEHSRLHLALGLLGFTAPQWRDEWQVTGVVMGYLSARRGVQTTASDVRFALGGKPAAMSPVEFEQELESMAALATGNAEGRAGSRRSSPRRGPTSRRAWSGSRPSRRGGVRRRPTARRSTTAPRGRGGSGTRRCTTGRCGRRCATCGPSRRGGWPAATSGSRPTRRADPAPGFPRRVPRIRPRTRAAGDSAERTGPGTDPWHPRASRSRRAPRPRRANPPRGRGASRRANPPRRVRLTERMTRNRIRSRAGRRRRPSRGPAEPLGTGRSRARRVVPRR